MYSSANTPSSVFRYVDWVTITIYAILVVAGAVSIYAASYDFDHASIFSFDEFSGKQLRWIGLSLILGFVILLTDYRMFETYAYPIYVLMIIDAGRDDSHSARHQRLTVMVGVRPGEHAAGRIRQIRHIAGAGQAVQRLQFHTERAPVELRQGTADHIPAYHSHIPAEGNRLGTGLSGIVFRALPAKA